MSNSFQRAWKLAGKKKDLYSSEMPSAIDGEPPIALTAPSIQSDAITGRVIPPDFIVVQEGRYVDRRVYKGSFRTLPTSLERLWTVAYDPSLGVQTKVAGLEIEES